MREGGIDWSAIELAKYVATHILLVVGICRKAQQYGPTDKKRANLSGA